VSDGICEPGGDGGGSGTGLGDGPIDAVEGRCGMTSMKKRLEQGWDLFWDEDGSWWVINAPEGFRDEADKLIGPFKTEDEAIAAGEKMVTENEA
jgi:hypothetical protein